MIRRIVGRLRRLTERPRNAARRTASELSRTVPAATESVAATVRAVRSNHDRVRVGVDIRPFFEPLTGVGWYLYHLLVELAKDDRLELVAFGEPVVADDGPRLHVELPPNIRMGGVDLRGKPLSRFSRPIGTAFFPLVALAERCDLYFGANYFLPRSLSVVARKRVVTVHDLTYRRYPELLQAETLANLELRMTRELTIADAIVCVSESTRRDLLEFYDIEPSRAVTVLSGLATLQEQGAPIAGLPQRYLLFVSTIEPRKNVLTLLDAFERLKNEKRYDGKLVLVGKIGWKSEDVVARLERSRWRDDIVHLDYLKREQLTTAYRQAELFVFPSLYEGFGFPLLEAMAYGVPTIAAKSSSLPEVGGDAALYFEPRDVGALVGAIERISSDPALRSEMIRRGHEQVSRFRWETAARETADIFLRVAGAQR